VKQRHFVHTPLLQYTSILVYLPILQYIHKHFGKENYVTNKTP